MMISFDYLVDTEELDGVRGRLFVDGYGTEHIPPPVTLRNVKVGVWEVFRAQAIFLIFGQIGVIFILFYKKLWKEGQISNVEFLL